MSTKSQAQQVLLRGQPGFRGWALGRAELRAGAVVAGLLVAAAVSFVSPAIGETLGPLGMSIGGAMTSILLVRRSRGLDGRERRAWIALAIGCASGVTGVFVMTGLTVAGVVLPAFGWFDGFFLLSYGLLSLSFLWLAVAEDDGPGWQTVVVDMLVGAISLTVLVWILVGNALVSGLATAPVWQRIVAPLYPVADIVVVLGLMAMTLRRTQFRFDPRLGMLGLGLALQVFADLSYLAAGLGSTFTGAYPRYELFLLSFACYLTTAVIVGRPPVRHEFADRPTPMWALMWPYVLAAALVAVHINEIKDVHLGLDEMITLVAAVLAITLVVGRQVYVISRHSGRVDAQRRELVASVSHELRTPLTGMLGFLELIHQDPDAFGEAERREMMATITDQARHLSGVVGDLIVLARDGGRTLPMKPGPVALGELCRRAIAATGVSGIELDVYDDVELDVDQARMTQAIVNLIDNARMYGAGRCRVIAGRSGSNAWIEVHDNGRGVPIRNQKAIWSQFERGRYRYDATAPGLGLGLSITRAVAKAHGGTATYRRSEILDGACFVIMVPVGAGSRS